LPAPSSRCDRRPGGQELPGLWKTAASRPASRSPEQFEVYFEVLLGFLGRRDQKKQKGLFSRVFFWAIYIFFFWQRLVYLQHESIGIVAGNNTRKNLEAGR
jgi:hypothetical protein